MLNNIIQQLIYSLLFVSILKHIEVPGSLFRSSLTSCKHRHSRLPGFFNLFEYTFAYLLRKTKFKTLICIFLIFIVNWLPLWRGCSLFNLAYGLVGDLSITTGMIVGITAIRRFQSGFRLKLLNLNEKIILLALGLVLYLSALGFIKYDIYSLGYESFPFILFFICLAIILVLANHLLGYIWFVALAAYYFKLQASNNLWDYLFDPLLWLILLFGLLLAILNRKLPLSLFRNRGNQV